VARIRPLDPPARSVRLDAGQRSPANGAVWEQALRTDYVLRYHVPVYVIVHLGTLPELGAPVYQDDFVTIYLLSQGQ
jgi:hypothetical protein